ncbi:MAG: hypothetical protein QNI84_08410 [Henriciella sp.]|nr:hypothetical protein [Henriciella sp.]
MARAAFPLLWCAALMGLCVHQMIALWGGSVGLFLPETDMQRLSFALFALFGVISIGAFAGTFRRALLWTCIFAGGMQILMYLAMAARQDTPAYTVPTFLTLIACAITWACIREPGPSAFNLSDEP